MTRVLRSVTTGFLCLSIAILIGCGNSSDSDGSGNDGSGNETEIDGVAFEYTGVLQFFEVPPGAVALNIAALGASGGDAANEGATSIFTGGHGAIVEMTLNNVTPGDTITILVGQQPQPQAEGERGCGASGGGGSFVVANYDETGGDGGASADEVAVAGGGGGASGRGGFDGQDASITKDGVDTLAGLGGTDGGGGRSGFAGGGGGFFGNGRDGDIIGIPELRSRGGESFTNGGAGGARDTECGDSPPGGYGGGGGGEVDAGAGGGGYSGGAGTEDLSGGGGGGSFDASEEGDISIRTQHGHGRVIIEAVF